MATSSLPTLAYEPLKGYKEIRVLILAPGIDDDTISCRLTSASLHDRLRVREYEALSYVWGDRNKVLYLHCNDTEIAVTLNLYNALKHLRYAEKERVLWADALCINQSDGAERSAQVQIMGEIFSAAQRTLIWLGEETIEVKDALLDVKNALRLFPIPEVPLRSASHSQVVDSTPQFLEACLQSFSTGEQSFLNYDWEPIANLLKRPWFRRKWIIQELVLAKEAILICGFRTLEWDYLEALFVHLQVSSLIQLVRDINVHQLASISASHIYTLATIREDPANFTLSNLLLLARGFLCEDPKDHIFAVFGLASDVEPSFSTPRPDYTIGQADLYRKYVQWSVMERRSLDFLSLAVTSMAKTYPGQPSWLPDFSIFEETSTMHNMIHVYSATNESKLQARFSDDLSTLFLCGRILDEVEAVGCLFEHHGQTSIHGVPISQEMDSEMNLAIRRRDWVLECKLLASEGPTELSEERLEELWRTMIWDFEAERGVRATSSLAVAFARYLENVETLLDEHDKEWYKELVTLSCGIDISIGMFSQGRRICKAISGRLCSMPSDTEVGDKICCFFGGRVLYVIRPGEGKSFQFVGDCYLHGLMDGKAMELDIEDTEIMLT